MIGFVQFSEEPDEDYRHADVDILLATRHYRARASGTRRDARDHPDLIEQRGHHRITLDDLAAQRAGDPPLREGRLPAGRVTRASERGDDGTWHDELLME